MADLKQQLTDDLTAAIKSKAEPNRTVLRSLTAAIKNAEIEQGGELDQTALTKLLQKQLKQRQESIEAYASRPVMAEAEKAEAAIIQGYLPEAMPEAELTKLIDATIAEVGASSPADIGKVMGAVTGKTAGRADNTQVAALVKAKLSE